MKKNFHILKYKRIIRINSKLTFGTGSIKILKSGIVSIDEAFTRIELSINQLI